MPTDSQTPRIACKLLGKKSSIIDSSFEDKFKMMKRKIQKLE